MRGDLFDQRWRLEFRPDLGNPNVNMIWPETEYDSSRPNDGHVLEIPIRGIVPLDCPFPASNKR